MYRHSRPSRILQIWEEQKVRLLSQFTELKEEDLNFETGRKQEMIERVAIKLGKSLKEMHQIFDAL